MGHDVNIHQDVYRLHDSVIELSKVSRLLMAVDDGNVSKFSGLSLSNINMDGLLQLSFCFAVIRLRETSLYYVHTLHTDC